MDEITVDRATLKALGADSRVAILKALGERRKTQAELAIEVQLSEPAVSEHLARLAAAGLIVKAESKGASHKWKYYELTAKGKALVIPSNVKVWFVLALSLFVFAASLNQVWFGLNSPVGLGGAGDVFSSSAMMQPNSPSNAPGATAVGVMGAGAPEMVQKAAAAGTSSPAPSQPPQNTPPATPQPTESSSAGNPAPATPLSGVDVGAIALMFVSLVAFGWCLGVLMNRR